MVGKGGWGSGWGRGCGVGGGERGYKSSLVMRAYQTSSPVILSTTVKAVPVLLAEMGVVEGEEPAAYTQVSQDRYDIIFVMQ